MHLQAWEEIDVQMYGLQVSASDQAYSVLFRGKQEVSESKTSGLFSLAESGLEASWKAPRLYSGSKACCSGLSPKPLFLVWDSNMPLMVHFHKQAPFLIGKEAVRFVATQMYAIYRLGAALFFSVGLGLEV